MPYDIPGKSISCLPLLLAIPNEGIFRLIVARFLDLLDLRLRVCLHVHACAYVLHMCMQMCMQMCELVHCVSACMQVCVVHVQVCAQACVHACVCLHMQV